MLGAIVLFGLLMPRAGVLIALPCLILVAALASRQTRFDTVSVVSMAGLVAFCIVVFVQGLGVPMPLLGTWFGG